MIAKGLVRYSALRVAGFGLAALLIDSVAMAAPPLNDSFVNRTKLSAISQSETIQNVNEATAEGGEPNPDNDYTKTVWFEWTAPDDGTLRLDTTNSQYAQRVHVFFGDSLNTLNFIASAENGAGISQGAIEIPVTKGSIYVVRFAGKDRLVGGSFPGALGYLHFNLRTNTPINGVNLLRPSTVNNDLFQNAITIKDAVTTVVSYSIFAGREGGEPEDTYDNTRWWNWTAPSDGRVTFTVSEDSNLTVWTGERVGELTPVGSLGYLRPAYTGFLDVVAGTIYRISASDFVNFPNPVATIFTLDFVPTPDGDASPEVTAKYLIKQKATGALVVKFSGTASDDRRINAVRVEVNGVRFEAIKKSGTKRSWKWYKNFRANAGDQITARIWSEDRAGQISAVQTFQFTVEAPQ